MDAKALFAITVRSVLMKLLHPSKAEVVVLHVTTVSLSFDSAYASLLYKKTQLPYNRVCLFRV